VTALERLRALVDQHTRLARVSPSVMGPLVSVDAADLLALLDAHEQALSACRRARVALAAVGEP